MDKERLTNKQQPVNVVFLIDIFRAADPGAEAKMTGVKDYKSHQTTYL